MGGNDTDDIILENTRAMADVPPPPPPPPHPPSTPGSPLKSPTAPLMPRGAGGGSSGDVNDANNNDFTSTDTTANDTATTPGGNSVAGGSSTNNNALMSPPLLLEIEEGTPAAEALKANADVRVSKLRKVGRSTRLQAGVRALKSAARTASGQPGHAGDRRGAPAFVAPRGGTQGKGMTTSSSSAMQPPTIPEVDDEGDSEHGDWARGGGGRTPRGSPKVSFNKESFEWGGGSVIDDQSRGDDSVSLGNQLDKSITLDDSSTDRDKAIPQPVPYATPSPAVESMLLAQQQHQSQRGYSTNHITHAALPAAVAAACRAGEDMDRKRATLIKNERSNSASKGLDADGAVQKYPLTPLANLFKSAEDDASPFKTNNSPVRSRPGHKRSQSVPVVTDKGFFHPPLMPGVPFRRMSMERNHQMPSEISVAETEKHSNFRHADIDQIEDLSDDGEEGEMMTTTIMGEGNIQMKKNVDINPIVVEIPGSLYRQNREETKEEEGATDDELDGNREALMAKAKKRMSRKASKRQKDGMDDDLFHSFGPKQVRKWINKRREKEESNVPRSYVKGKVIDGKHELYTMSIAVMFGMRTSIGRTNLAMSQTAHNERRWLDNDDLMAVEKYEFPPRGSDLTPPHQLNHTFKFKDYSPLAFAYLRRMFGVNEYDFLLSVCGNANYIEFQSNAKSGQFFFYSPDGKYMIKTMTNTESKFLRRILPHYFRHCSTNPNTLVTKFLGMYRVKLYHLRRNVKFVVMKSVYDTDKVLHELFDVKGSTTGRDAPNDAVKKDNDIRRYLPDGAFIMEPGLRKRMQLQVKGDCEWLKSMKIMDYSMLIGVHNIAHRNTRKLATQLTPSRVLSNDDGDGGSTSSYEASYATLDRYLNVDDDDSYLDGYHNNKERKTRVTYETSSTSDEAVRTVRVLRGSENADDESSKVSKDSMKGTEALAEKAIEDMYWPYHRFYDIQGFRRMNPVRESLLAPPPKTDNKVTQSDQKEEKTLVEMIFSPKAEVPMSSGGQCELPTFEKPLSYRKDGGFTMDTSTTGLPLKREVAGNPHLYEYCDGKIFYMGIIDILQQFNIRKRGEARYRRLGGKGWDDASCVHPSVYADRFMRFFDEYTEGPPRTANSDVPNENASVASDSAANAEITPKVVKKKSM